MKLWFRKSTGAGVEVPDTATVETVTPPEKAPTAPGAGTLRPSDAPPGDAAAAHPPPRSTASPSPGGDSGPSSRSLFKQILDSQYDAVLITDLKGHIVNTNRRTQDYFGYAPDETWDLPIGHLVPGITDAMLQQILTGLARERHVLIDGRCVRKDESGFPAEIAISQITLTNDGNLLFCIRNIERRHLTMQRLQSTRRLLDQIPTPAVACDRESRIKVANLALARMLGHESPDLLENQPFSCVWNEPRAAEVVARVLGGETVKEPIVVMNLRGKPLHLVASLAPEQDAREKAIGFLASFTSAAVVSLNSH